MAVKPKGKGPAAQRLEEAVRAPKYGTGADVDRTTDFVRFDDIRDPMPAVAGTITVTGTASPDDAVVRGTLTVKNDANQPLPGAGGPAAGTIPATGPVTCSGGDWSLQFENVPPGNYIISVNEELPSEGAAAANLDVTAQIVISVTAAPGDLNSTPVYVVGP